MIVIKISTDEYHKIFCGESRIFLKFFLCPSKILHLIFYYSKKVLKILTNAEVHHFIQQHRYCQRNWKDIAAIDSDNFQFIL